MELACRLKTWHACGLVTSMPQLPQPGTLALALALEEPLLLYSVPRVRSGRPISSPTHNLEGPVSFATTAVDAPSLEPGRWADRPSTVRRCRHLQSAAAKSKNPLFSFQLKPTAHHRAARLH